MSARRIARWCRGNLAADPALSVAIGVVLVLLPGEWFIESADSQQRQTLYAAMAGGGASLFGMAALALAVIKGVGSGPRSQKLRDLHGPEITQVMTAFLWSLGATVAVALLLLLADTGKHISGLGAALVYSVLALVLIRGARTIWLVGILLQSEDADASAQVRTRERPTPRAKRPEDGTGHNG